MIADATLGKTRWTTSSETLERAKWTLISRKHTQVHMGFLTQYLGKGNTAPDGKSAPLDEQLNERVLRAVRAQLDEIRLETPGREELLVCGHSLGGALATCCVFDLFQQGVAPLPWLGETPVTLVTFGSPRTGNYAFARAFRKLQGRHRLHFFRLQNEIDFIPSVPPGNFGYKHVGQHVWVHSDKVQKPTRPGHTPLSARSGAGYRLCGGTAQKSLHNHPMEGPPRERNGLAVAWPWPNQPYRCIHTALISRRPSELESDVASLPIPSPSRPDLMLDSLWQNTSRTCRRTRGRKYLSTRSCRRTRATEAQLTAPLV